MYRSDLPQFLKDTNDPAVKALQQGLDDLHDKLKRDEATLANVQARIRDWRFSIEAFEDALKTLYVREMMRVDREEQNLIAHMRPNSA